MVEANTKVTKSALEIVRDGQQKVWHVTYDCAEMETENPNTFTPEFARSYARDLRIAYDALQEEIVALGDGPTALDRLLKDEKVLWGVSYDLALLEVDGRSLPPALGNALNDMYFHTLDRIADIQNPIVLANRSLSRRDYREGPAGLAMGD